MWVLWCWLSLGLIALVNTLLDSLGAMIGLVICLCSFYSVMRFNRWPSSLAFRGRNQMAGSLIGQKLVFNEFVAFVSFTDQMTLMSVRSQAIVTFALCGFANFFFHRHCARRIGMMAPNRRKDIAEFGPRRSRRFHGESDERGIAGFFLSIG